MILPKLFTMYCRKWLKTNYVSDYGSTKMCKIQNHSPSEILVSIKEHLQWWAALEFIFFIIFILPLIFNFLLFDRCYFLITRFAFFMLENTVITQHEVEWAGYEKKKDIPCLQYSHIHIMRSSQNCSKEQMTGNI